MNTASLSGTVLETWSVCLQDDKVRVARYTLKQLYWSSISNVIWLSTVAIKELDAKILTLKGMVCQYCLLKKLESKLLKFNGIYQVNIF